MTAEASRSVVTQSVDGNQNIQISHLSNSQVQITYGAKARLVPLEPATIPIGQGGSAARLVQARSGIVPFTARPALLADLVEWLDGEEPFQVRLIGGPGGAGKTRLGVELCEVAQKLGWLTGVLKPVADAAQLQELVQAPLRRLIVVDYAETRLAQLEALLPLLAAHATAESPVRVVLLVRDRPRAGHDLAAVLRDYSDGLDSVIDGIDVDPLPEMPLSERQALFAVAASAFADRDPDNPATPAVPETLAASMYSTPLPVVAAAYLALHDLETLPESRHDLLERFLVHEDRYWEATSRGLRLDKTVRRRAVALATLAGAVDEDDAAALLRLVPDLADASEKDRRAVARWTHELYATGDQWWNPLEPDLLGEHLVASCWTAHADVLAGVLQSRADHALVHPLLVLTRASADRPALAAALSPVLTNALPGLVAAAVAQANNETDLALLLSDTTVAAVTTRAIAIVPIEPTQISAVLKAFPDHENLVLDELECALTGQLVEHLRATGSGPQLGEILHTYSFLLGNLGRRTEALAAIEESVEIVRRIVSANPTANEPALARSYTNLSAQLSDMGRESEGLTAIEKAVEIFERLVAINPDEREPELALAYNNLANQLSAAGRGPEALAAAEKSVEIRVRLAAANAAVHEPQLASSYNNLSSHLSDAGREPEALAAIEKAVDIYERLAAVNPAAHERALIFSYHNLSLRLGAAGRGPEALAAAEKSVDICDRLAAANAVAYERDLASSLANLSGQLSDAGREPEALAAIEKAVDIYDRLAAANPAAHGRSLAVSYQILSLRYGAAGREPEAIAAAERSKDIRERLGEADR